MLITIPRPIRDAVMPELERLYSEGERHYHTFSHARKVYETCSLAHEEVGLRNPTEVALAALFHDAVYDPRALPGVNESASARLVQQLIRRASERLRFIDEHTVDELIHATSLHGHAIEELQLTHNDPEDVQLLLDADMLGFGSEWEGFARNTELIRREYAHLDEESWRRGRARFLARLYGNERVFLSDFFHDKYETQARANIDRLFGDKHWLEPLKWNADAAKRRERQRVFCASMADVFEARNDLLRERLRLLELVATTPHLDWLLLTKRPENILRQLTEAAELGSVLAAEWVSGDAPDNVWIGTTVEDKKRRDERITELVKVPARVRFLSCEPLLEGLDLSRYLDEQRVYRGDTVSGFMGWEPQIHWVIVGGESGRAARRFNVEWARHIVAQCREAEVHVFVKQLGDYVVDRNDRFNTCADTSAPADWWPLDDPDAVEENINGFREEYQGAPVRIRLGASKGGNPDEWPEDLRVREFPEPAVRS